MNDPMRRRAAALLTHLATSAATAPDAVAAADLRTSVADARAALCVAAGVALADIGPTGYDRSRRAYDRVRASWVGLIEQHGITGMYTRPQLAEVYADWSRYRPDDAAGDDWAAAGVAAHRRYWARHGRRCNGDCLLHEPAGEWEYVARYPSGACARWPLHAPEAVLRSPGGAVLARGRVPAGADLFDLATVVLSWGDAVSLEREPLRCGVYLPSQGGHCPALATRVEYMDAAPAARSLLCERHDLHPNPGPPHGWTSAPLAEYEAAHGPVVPGEAATGRRFF